MHGLGDLPGRLAHESCAEGAVVLDGSALEAIDSAGALLLQRWLVRHRARPDLRGWPPRLQRLMGLAAEAQLPGVLPAPCSAICATLTTTITSCSSTRVANSTASR